MDSAIAQTLPSVMFVVERGDSADIILLVHAMDVSVTEPGGWGVEPLDLTVEGMWLCASGILGTLER